MLAGLALLTAATAEPPAQLANIFWQACADGQVALSADWAPIAETEISPRIKKRLKGYSAVMAFKSSDGGQSILVIADFASPSNGVVKRCGLYSTRWNAYQAYRQVYPLMYGKDAPRTPGLFIDSSLVAYQNGYEIKFEDTNSMGLSEVVFYDAETAKRLLEEAKAARQSS